MNCTHFACDDLKMYTDSMLFDSGTCVASGNFENNGKVAYIDLQVCGEVKVIYKGETYTNPSEFPEELIDRIKNHPKDWMTYAPSGEGNDDEEGDIDVLANNWFEMSIKVGAIEDEYSNSDIFEKDISKMTKDDVKKEMEDVAKEYFFKNEKATKNNGTIRLAVSWEMCGYVDVPAATVEEAMEYFNENVDEIELPTDGEYVDGSFTLSSDDAEMQEVMGNS